MDLTSPLNSLVPSLNGAVLEVLAGTESALGASQIHRLTRRGARSGVHRVLDRLVELGLVSAERTNHGYAYRLNRGHVLAGAVLAGANARQEFIRRLTGACAGLDPPVLSAALFGSTARRESGPGSDVDLVLVIEGAADPDSADWQRQLRALEDSVAEWTGNRLEHIVITDIQLAQLVASGEPLIDSWHEDAVTLVGSDLPTMIRNAPAPKAKHAQ